MANVVAQPRTLGDALLPRGRSLWTDAALVVGFSVFVALTARVQIPLWPVPFTLQTLGVLLAGAALGSRRGGLALLLYLAEGAAGLPVFAGPPYGVARFAGPTGGYLLGFVVAAALVGWLAERGWDRRVWTAAAAMVLGNLVIYAFGVSWLAVALGDVAAAISKGLLLFIPGDLAKIAVAALVLPGAWVATNKRIGDQ